MQYISTVTFFATFLNACRWYYNSHTLYIYTDLSNEDQQDTVIVHFGSQFSLKEVHVDVLINVVLMLYQCCHNVGLL